MKKKRLLFILVFATALLLSFTGCDKVLQIRLVDKDTLNDDAAMDISSDIVSDALNQADVTNTYDIDASGSDALDSEQEKKDKKDKDADKKEKQKTTEEILKDAETVSEKEYEDMSNEEKIKYKLSEEEALHHEPDSYEKTMAMYELSKEIMNLSSIDFSSKCMTFIGDSITAGYGCGIDEEGAQISYPYYIGKNTGCTYLENMGISGSTVGSYIGDTSMINRISLVPTESEIIVVFGGVNDYANYNTLIGDDSKAPGTYSGDLYEMMNNLRQGHPDARIYFVTTYRNRYENDECATASYALDSFMQLQRDYAKDFNIKIIDVHKWGYMNNNDERVKAEFFVDNLHPGNEGSKLLAYYVLAQIIGDYTTNK